MTAYTALLAVYYFNAFDQFPIPQLLEDGDLVVPELIAVCLICHDVSPFLIDALRVSPETKMAQPELTGWAKLWFMAATKTACLIRLNGASHLLSLFGIWLKGS
jgi:hypothetical protein